MKRITIILAILSALGTGGVLWQRHTLSSLPSGQTAVGFPSSDAFVDSNQLAALESEVARLKNEAKDLPRLRSEAGQLRSKQNDLVSARAENERLRDARRTGAPLPREVPPGFIGRNELHNAGYGTPEDTVQTLFWALREGDYEALMQSFVPDNRERVNSEKLSPEKRAQVASEFKREMADDMMRKFNDFSIARREETSEDTVVLHVRSSLGTNTLPHRLRRVGQEWKLVDL